MIFNKTNSRNPNSTTVNTRGESSSSSTSVSSKHYDRFIWSQFDESDEDINGTLLCNGNIYISSKGERPDLDADEDDDEGVYDADAIPEYNYEGLDEIFDSEQGNLYVENNIQADGECYGKKLFLDINGIKTNLLDVLMPVGSIIGFNGSSTVPANWVICDGTNGTPNLKDKFIKGVTSTSAVGSTGGTSTHTLTVEELPSHNHSATTNVDLDISREDAYLRSEWKDKFFIGYKETYYQVFDMGGEKHFTAETGYEEPTDKGIAEVPIKDLLDATGNVTGTATANTTIGNTGNGESFNIEPPYYTLIYIMRIK